MINIEDLKMGDIVTAKSVGLVGGKRILASCACCGIPRLAGYNVTKQVSRNKYCPSCATKVNELGEQKAIALTFSSIDELKQKKTCSKCHRELSITDFPIKAPSRMATHPPLSIFKYHSQCHDCRRAKTRDYAKRHPYALLPTEQIAARLQSRRARYLELCDFLNLLKQRPCRDCGNVYPHYMMEFDHRDGSTKLGNACYRGDCWGKVLKELAKCDVVCANCHRARGWKRITHKITPKTKIATRFHSHTELALSTVQDWLQLFPNNTSGRQRPWVSAEMARQITVVVQALLGGK